MEWISTYKTAKWQLVLIFAFCYEKFVLQKKWWKKISIAISRALKNMQLHVFFLNLPEPEICWKHTTHFRFSGMSGLKLSSHISYALTNQRFGNLRINLQFFAKFEIFVIYFPKFLPFLKKMFQIFDSSRKNFYKILTFCKIFFKTLINQLDLRKNTPIISWSKFFYFSKIFRCIFCDWQSINCRNELH